jgi:hypothetical protein
MIAGIGLATGPIIVSYFMGQFGNSVFFMGVGGYFAMILLFISYRMKVSEAISPSDQGPAIAVGVIGAPVAQYNAPDAEEYVEALIQDELHRLDDVYGEVDDKSPDDDGKLDIYMKE